MRLGLVSAKGAPGVTTLALSVSVASGAVMVEADPSGGDVECWVGPQGEPGLVRVASGARHGADPAVLLETCATEVLPGARVVLAPAGGLHAESALIALGDRLAPVLAACEVPVVVDAGRWERGQATAGRLAGCDVIGLVTAPTVAGVAHAAALVGQLADAVRARVVVIPVGDRSYPGDEIEAAVGVSVLGPVLWDPRGVRALVTGGLGQWGRRSALARSTRSLLGQLTAAGSQVAVRDD